MKILRIAFVIFFLTLIFFAFQNHKPIEANILKAISNDSLLIDLSGRFGSRVNILFNGDDAGEVKEKFLSKIDKSKFKEANYENIFRDYKKYPRSFLTPHSRKLLQKKQYHTIEQEGLERLYGPTSVFLISPNIDPYLFFSEYILNLDDGSHNEEILRLDFKDEIAKSTSLLNIEMKKLVQLQKELSNDEVQIYISGVPIHSYYASSKSIIEINIISIVSLTFMLGVCYFYFRSTKILLPIFISLSFGVLTGYALTAIIFPTIHILTFVFSTTLIGICLDYSLHYFIENGIEKIRKGLVASTLIAVCAFMSLMFSHITLLNQIAIFTSMGLVSVYCLVTLFFPLIKIKIEKREINFSPKISKKAKVAAIVLLVLFFAFGISRVKFNDDIRTMYKPPKVLIEAEKMVNQSPNVSFLKVEEKNFENLMQKEEEIAQTLDDKGIKYVALSKFIPSKKMQTENQKLIKDLYNKNLDKYGTFLTSKERQELNSAKTSQMVYDGKKHSALNDFIIGNNTTLMILYDAKDLSFKDVRYINPQKDISREGKKCRESCLKLFPVLFFVIYFVLAIMYGPKNAFKLVVPPMLGIAFCFSLLGILNQEINLFHVLSAFLIIGFSIDYSIFRFSVGKNSRDVLLISCITTSFSFLLLAFTSFKLISSLGFMLVVGLLSSYIFSLFIVPEAEAIDRK